MDIVGKTRSFCVQLKKKNSYSMTEKMDLNRYLIPSYLIIN